MKKKYFIISALALLVPFLFQSCDPLPDPPEADFSATILNSSSDITISFSDISSGSPDEWFWTFEGGYPSTSTDENPTVTYSTSGTYDVTLTVTNNGGDDEISVTDFINVVELYNTTFTDIDITVGNITKTIFPDYSVLFAQLYEYDLPYYAVTSGLTAEGTIVGEELEWDETLDLSYYTSYDLYVGSDFIFLYLTNTTAYNFNPLVVNAGTIYETADNIFIPNDWSTYETGYYYAFYGMEVRAFHYGYLTYDSWYIYPLDEDNLYAVLDDNKSTQAKSEGEIEKLTGEPEMLIPCLEVKSKTKFHPNAKKLAPTNKK